MQLLRHPAIYQLQQESMQLRLHVASILAHVSLLQSDDGHYLAAVALQLCMHHCCVCSQHQLHRAAEVGLCMLTLIFISGCFAIR